MGVGGQSSLIGLEDRLVGPVPDGGDDERLVDVPLLRRLGRQALQLPAAGADGPGRGVNRPPGRQGPGRGGEAAAGHGPPGVT